ncbi:hypothetical protein FRX31_004656 [Thalictrum thalictroides]|uniref:Uncharacterized protein n=1 Tax=Thalictrum thalictroides TaxID=46969 RepID=A0A7J6XA05_THATH|nr:hypothetical protein FRX31_004656 [Thalictrum thalictroides]
MHLSAEFSNTGSGNETLKQSIQSGSGENKCSTPALQHRKGSNSQTSSTEAMDAHRKKRSLKKTTTKKKSWSTSLVSALKHCLCISDSIDQTDQVEEMSDWPPFHDCSKQMYCK